MSLLNTLRHVQALLLEKQIEHALIGGLALASHGIQRATMDIDFLVAGKDRDKLKKLMESQQWLLVMETPDVLHFKATERVDFLLARCPMSLEMLASAKAGGLGIRVVLPEGIIGLKIQAYKNNPRRELQDKADIQSIIEKFPQLDWEKIKELADLFDEWAVIKKLRDSL